VKGFGNLFLISVFSMTASTSAATFTENFNTLDHADQAHSTGIWNVIDHSIRAQAYADGANVSTRTIDAGDGSDGVVNSSSGFTFDTDSHPNGYQFQSLAITGGTITVVGSHPLIIKSLQGITITPALKVNGADGANGTLSGATASGGAAVTCQAKGGNGGSANGSAASSGGNAVYSTGATEASSGGVGQIGGAYSATIESQTATFSGPAGYDFDTSPATDFICGTGGAGGGGYSLNGTEFASGGGGGAGGGIMKLIAVGDIQVGVTEAKGGNGGNGVQLSNSACSGSGTGGYGGVIFFQTLGNLTTGVDPDVSGGQSGSSPCFGGNGIMLLGFARGDLNSVGAAPGWIVVSYATEKVPSNLTSFVQSSAYDLGVLNASLSDENITSTGNVTMTYAGSADGVRFSDFAPLESMSNRGYRYIKFRANFTNPAAGNVAPDVSAVSFSFTDLGLSQLDIKLLAGCGTMSAARHSPSSSESNAAGVLFTLFGILTCYGMSRFRLG
jgi:hypothetical protein